MKRLLAALLLLATALTAVAQVPTLMSYQGRVSDASGTLIGTSSPVNRTVTFKFYTAASGGTLLYAESQSVTISAGEFSVLLGNGNGVAGLPGRASPASPTVSLASALTGTAYLGLTVEDGTSAADPEITPRQQIVSAAFALRAKVAETILDGALVTAMLANTSVTTDKLSGGSVTNAKLATDAVNTTNLVAGSITESRLASGAVTNGKIADGSVTGNKIALGTIGAGNIADGQINAAKITDNSITSVDIGDGQVTTADLALGSVDVNRIADGHVTTAKLAGGAVTNDRITNGAVDINKLAEAIKQALCPPGTILAYAGDSAPAGWLMCDGTMLNRNSYSTLFAVIGTRFGYTDGSNFRIPDFRGRFLRGRDAGATRDPDRHSRSAMNANGSTGDAVGSIQGDEFRSHRHSIPTDGAGGGVDQNSMTGTSSNDETWSYSPGSGYEGGNETRPINAYVNFIIKV